MKITNEKNDIEKILFTEEQIAARVKLLGDQLTKEYQDKFPVVVCILKGASFFYTDLCRAIHTDIYMDFISVSRLLENADIHCGDFRAFIENVGPGDFVFLDPPYLPDPAGGSFVDYNKDGFAMQDHEDVVRLALEARDRGAYVMATNNDSPLTREMWSGFHFHEYSTRMCIKPGRKRTEVAMTSWEPEPLDTIDRFC